MQKSQSGLLLTVALPVFNDSQALLATINSLVPELQASAELIEILVSDNCSAKDSTSDFKDALSGFPNATVVRQKSNLGFAGNLGALANIANGTYIWFIGAGDTLVPGAISGVMDLLRDRKVSWGTVMGLFNYHRHEEYQEPKVAHWLSSSLDSSSTAVYNHAISLNIFKTEIIRDFGACIGHSVEYLQRSSKVFGQVAKVSPQQEACHWPHLEAVGKYASENSDRELVWFEYLPKTILLNSNRNGNWDKSSAAMRIFSQWSEVVAYTSAALPLSRWLHDLRMELRGWHLLRFTFMLKQDSTLESAEILLHQRTMQVSLLFRICARLICWLPKPAIQALVWTRRRFWPQAPAHQTAR